MKTSKYTSIFSSTVRPVVSEEKDKFLSLASMVDLEKFVPNIDTEKEVDLLPVAFNAFVANRVNKNGDVIDTSTAMEIKDSFVNKPINIEHNRDKIIGTILTTGYSEFGTDKPLTEEEVKDSKGPFNVTLGGILWRVVNPELADYIEDSADPTSENYMNVSASWELGFADYQILAVEGDEKNTENAEVINDESSMAEMKDHLRAFGGKGKLDDGRSVYRQVINDVLPLGIGLTETPAADVAGLASKITFVKKEDLPIEQEAVEEKTISQVVKNDVNQNYKGRNMKLNSIKDITDESLKELSASVVSDFIEEQLKEASEKFNEDKTETETALKAAKDDYDKLSAEHSDVREQLEKLSNSIAELEKEKAERIALDKFNERMASLDEAYELLDEDRQVIATQIKNLDEESFEKYLNDMKVLLSSRVKTDDPDEEEEKEETVEQEQAEAKASVEPSVEEVVEEALDKAEEIKEEIPVSANASEADVYDKYKKAFDMGNWSFNR
jgi:hypothetical protein